MIDIDGTCKTNIIYNNIIYEDINSVSVNSENSGYPKRRLTDKIGSTTYRSDGVSSITITINFAELKDIKFIGLINTNLQASDIATRNDGTTDHVMTHDDDLIYYLNTSGISNQVSTITFTINSAITYIEIGQIFVSDSAYSFEIDLEQGYSHGESSTYYSSNTIRANTVRINRSRRKTFSGGINVADKAQQEVISDAVWLNAGYVIFTPYGNASGEKSYFGILDTRTYRNVVGDISAINLTFLENPKQ